MERPLHLETGVQRRSRWRRIAAIAVAVALEAGAIFVVGSGLATRVVTQLPQTLKVDIFHPPPPKEAPPPPPQAQFVKPSLPTVPPPLIHIQAPPRPSPMTVVQSIRPVQPPPVIAPAPPKPAPPKVPAPTPPRGIESTHTQPPYPVLARRIGEQGTVLLKITVNADGSVQNVTVARSSGDNDLDEAALDWVKAHWRYKPATRDGKPVVAQAEAQVVFNLKQAQESGLL
ncbi:MAG TPA: energy transducer TonB [Rhizomicrobium sp.]|nr:energy transducer TonB [Rhizomicrobium sp.]